MPRLDIPEMKKENSEILRGLEQKGEPALPMPHQVTSGSVSYKEFMQYDLRKKLHLERMPKYEEQFGLPQKETVDAIWRGLGAYGRWLSEDKDPNETPRIAVGYIGKTWVTNELYGELIHRAKQAFIIALDLFVSYGKSNKTLTFNYLFDALCQKFSDHYRQTRAKPARIVRDMSKERVMNCRRDLLLNGVNISTIWLALVKKDEVKRERLDTLASDIYFEPITPFPIADETVGVPLNPLFNVVDQPGSGRGKLLKKIILPEAPNRSKRLNQFMESLDNDTQYIANLGPCIKVLFPKDVDAADHDTGKRFEASADVPYNVVELGKKSKGLITTQSRVRLLFDVDAFKKDYGRRQQEKNDLAKRLQNDGVNPDLPSAKRPMWLRGGETKERWSEREEHVYFQSIAKGLRQRSPDITNSQAQHELSVPGRRKTWEDHRGKYLDISKGKEERWYPRLSAHGRENQLVELVQAAHSTGKWRSSVEKQLAEYDNADRFLTTYEGVYNQVNGLSGPQPISSKFYKSRNRRYQPQHFWPTFVTDKKGFSGGEESDVRQEGKGEQQSYRKKWFKAPDPTGKPCDLKGVDISSSQTQIIAAFFGIEKLERLAMGQGGPSFKEVLATRALELNEKLGGKLFREDPNVPNFYKCPAEEHLQALVKYLWMRVLYGSTVQEVAETQRSQPDIFGPAWTTENAGNFLKQIEADFPQVKEYKAACRQLATLAFRRENGVRLTDPFDQAKVIWNPVAREEEYVDVEKHKVILSTPGMVKKSKTHLEEGEFLFSIDAARESELDQGLISKELQRLLRDRQSFKFPIEDRYSTALDQLSFPMPLKEEFQNQREWLGFDWEMPKVVIETDVIPQLLGQEWQLEDARRRKYTIVKDERDVELRVYKAWTEEDFQFTIELGHAAGLDGGDFLAGLQLALEKKKVSFKSAVRVITKVPHEEWDLEVSSRRKYRLIKEATRLGVYKLSRLPKPPLKNPAVELLPENGQAKRWKIEFDRRLYLARRENKAIVIHEAKQKKVRVGHQAINGQYPVDQKELGNMVGPCLVHMLDAYYSSIVMTKLHSRGIKNFVGIHDCWLVPEFVRLDGEAQNRLGLDILKEVMDEADKEWYKGLGPVYKRLYAYLGEDEKFGKFIKDAYDGWRNNIKEDKLPRFKYFEE